MKGKFPFIPANGCVCFAFVVMMIFAVRSQAFSLLGPFADWMYATNGYHMETDIGGPMNINEGYRWNVPVVTYGFDKSFLDYFGSNGVAAVESAIQVLNDLPPASDIVLSNYPPDTIQINNQAGALGAYDLKSATLALLFEQMGLTQPARNIFDIRQWVPAFAPPYSPPTLPNESCGESCFDWAIPNFVIERNFDPETLAPSHSVDGVLYSGYILYETNQLTDVVEFPVEPPFLLHPYTAVGDAFSSWYQALGPGYFYSGLTADDVGGIRYLLSQTNINYENLLPKVYSRGTARRPINGALRPGVERITFMPHLARRDGRFGTIEIRFIDTCITNGVVVHQKVRRIVHQPDFLFSAADVGDFLFARSGTTNWVNNAGLNGAATNDGPGVIRPPVTITFAELGPIVETTYGFETYVVPQSWGSFDGSTNPAVLYPAPTGRSANGCNVRFTAVQGGVIVTNQMWHLNVSFGQAVAFQINTNGTDWTTATIVTNTAGSIEWFYQGQNNPLPLFNVVPAP